jgi:hypothetical protein
MPTRSYGSLKKLRAEIQKLCRLERRNVKDGVLQEALDGFKVQAARELDNLVGVTASSEAG